MSTNPIVNKIIEKNKQEDPRLILILEEIRLNMDVQIEQKRKEIEEKKEQIEYLEQMRLAGCDKWSKYKVMSYATGAQILRHTKERDIVEAHYDRIVAEG